MMRLKGELAAHTGLVVVPFDGDLVLRIRRPRFGQAGWEVLICLSARPLSVRAWRVCDMKGALNAAVAHAMVLLTQPESGDHFLNMACGSGTLLIERLVQGPAQRVIGCDLDPAALQCARANIAASGHEAHIELYGWDARALPLPDASMDAICTALPFGHAIGSHAENVELYPMLLQEGARVAKPGARACLLTHEVKLIEELVGLSEKWMAKDILKISVGGFHPRIFVLERSRTPP
jgi:23S rRNA G2445 N2-methylase RlmL